MRVQSAELWVEYKFIPLQSFRSNPKVEMGKQHKIRKRNINNNSRLQEECRTFNEDQF